jgi:hypothetical protein
VFRSWGFVGAGLRGATSCSKLSKEQILSSTATSETGSRGDRGAHCKRNVKIVGSRVFTPQNHGVCDESQRREKCVEAAHAC